MAQVAAGLGGVEFLDEAVGPHQVGNVQVPARDVGGAVGPERGDADILGVSGWRGCRW